MWPVVKTFLRGLCNLCHSGKRQNDLTFNRHGGRSKNLLGAGASYLVKIYGGEQITPPPSPVDPTGSGGPVQCSRLAPAMTPSTIVHGLCSKPTVNILTCFQNIIL